MALLQAGISAGATLIGGLLGNRQQRKAANEAFNYQATLNTAAFNQQLHLNREAFQQQDALLRGQNQEVRLLNDRVDAFNRDILANHSTNETRTEDTSFTQGSIDFGRMVKDAEAAGFNPLAVLRAGGLAGYSTSNVRTTNVTSQRVARDLMTYFAPSQTPQAPHPGQAPSPGQAPQPQYENAWGNAIQAGLQAWRNHDKHAAERQQLELGIARAQLANLNSDTAMNNRRFAIPTWTGSSQQRSAGGFAGRVATGGGTGLGSVATPTQGEVKVTNPWPLGVVNPHARDAAAHEERYGELGGSLIGLGNLVVDGVTNLYNTQYGREALKNDVQTVKNAGSYFKKAYDAMVWAWNHPALNTNVKVDWIERPR